MKLKATNKQLVYVNLGCGSIRHSDWNNFDQFDDNDVVFQDLRKPLKIADKQVDFVYHSHTLEHLSYWDAIQLLNECYRILKDGGICRIVVPDLEQLTHNYLFYLNQYLDNPTKENYYKYFFCLTYMIDDMTKETIDSSVLKYYLRKQYFNQDFVNKISGESHMAFYEHQKNKPLKGKDKILKKLNTFYKLPWNQKLKVIKDKYFKEQDTRKNGYAHKWMWDRVALDWHLHQAGFKETKVQTWYNSDIVDWHVYNLDANQEYTGPSKVGSIFFEAIK